MFTRRFLIVTLTLHLITAWFSAGFHHYDEHFQIFEFLQSKFDPTLTLTDLPWEYARQMRSWVLPAFFYPWIQIARFLGFSNPAGWTTFLRLLTAGLSWGSCLGLAHALGTPQTRRRLAWSLQLLWLLPYLHVRTSSETYASLLFFSALALVVPRLPSGKRCLGAGILAGLAFECRFHAGFLIVGLTAWLVCIPKWPWRKLFLFCSGVGLALLLGRLLDRWGYGSWSLSPWNYVTANLIENKAAEWGVLPWWGYFLLISKLFPPLGILLALSTLGFWILFPRHVLTWSLVPFWLVHCAVGHKELRFLIPMAWVSGAHVVLLLDHPRMQRIRTFLSRSPWPQGFWILNAGGLVALAFLPARTELAFYERLHERFPQTLRYVAVADEDPFVMAQLQANFFKPKETERFTLPDWESVALKRTQGQSFFLYHEGLEPKTRDRQKFQDCAIVCSSLSEWERTHLPAKVIQSQRVQTLRLCP